MEQFAMYAAGYRPQLIVTEQSSDTAKQTANQLLDEGWECIRGMVVPITSGLSVRAVANSIDHINSYETDPRIDRVIGPWVLGKNLKINGIGIWERAIER